CGGVAMAAGELAEWLPDVTAQLALETDEKSGAFAKTRTCPTCSAPMAPWRIGKLQAWVERCPACELYWLEKQDVRTLQMLSKKRSTAQAFASIPKAERDEMTQGVAAASGELARMK